MLNKKEEKQIAILKNCIVNAISPIKIYLFGSFANGTAKEESDYDFYVIVNDEEQNILDLTQKAYRAMRGKKNRPVDIVVARESNFKKRKDCVLSLEKEIHNKGVLLYSS